MYLLCTGSAICDAKLDLCLHDLQWTTRPKIHEDETRCACSYHSYSRSPPYDYQYEDQRYGKQAATLTGKPGSDESHYEGKMSSFNYSPGRFTYHAYEDRFTNDETGKFNLTVLLVNILVLVQVKMYCLKQEMHLCKQMPREMQTELVTRKFFVLVPASMIDKKDV